MRSIESIRRKRKKYRARKKLIFHQCTSNFGNKIIKSVTSINQDDQPSEASSDLYRGIGSDRWDPMLDEAARARQRKREVEEEKEKLYGSFEDPETSFPDGDRKLKLPASLSGIDRVSVTSQLQDMRSREKDALFTARFYRDRCTELLQHCRELENEKEKVRFFWRNKVLEGQSRAGRMVNLAINKQLRTEKS